MKKVAVILSGCGYLDGAEIHEATLTLLALDLAGASYTCMAPSIQQSSVVDHATRQPETSARNVLSESARIARCVIKDIAGTDPVDYDAVMIPGGYGVASNLTSLASSGADMSVDADVARFLSAMVKAEKPVAALCIAPPLVAWVLNACGISGVRMTIGNDPGTADVIRRLGQVHVECPADDCVVDAGHRVVTSPAYMRAMSIAEVWAGVSRTVNALLNF